MSLRRSSLKPLRAAGISVLSLLALGAAGCCGLLCAPCTGPLGTSGSPPPPPVFAPPAATTPPPAPPSLPPPLVAEPTPARAPGLAKSAGALRLQSSIDAPVRGSFINIAGSNRFVPHKAFNAAPLGSNQLVVVHATTGLWLHERNQLRRIARLVPPPIDAMAVSPDGSTIAVAANDVATGKLGLRILGYPGLETRAFIPEIDTPARMRFSPDGKQIVIASESDFISLIDVATGKKDVYDTDEDVNDAIVMPDNSNEVAYASDDDELVIADIRAQKPIFSSAELIDSYQQKRWNSSLSVFVERDQMAVAYDPDKDRLIGGGDDNIVWQFDGIRTKAPKQPLPKAPIEFDGNIREIACCRKGGAFVVALDTLAVFLLNGAGRRTASLGPLLDTMSSGAIRIALLPDTEGILVTFAGKMLRWDPGARSVMLAQDYEMAQVDQASELSGDTVFVGCDGRRCAVQRARHNAAPGPDAEALKVGDAPLPRVDRILVFSGDLRALAGSSGSKLRLVFLPSGASLEPPFDVPGVLSGGSFSEKGDGNTYGYLEKSGKIFEISASPKGAVLLGKAKLPPNTIGELTWDSMAKKWKVFDNNDIEMSVLPP